VQAVKSGAFDYIHKGPGLLEELKISVGRALETMTLQRENFALKRDAATRNSLDNIIGNSPPIEKLKSHHTHGCSHGSTVLIYGESGSGKELWHALFTPARPARMTRLSPLTAALFQRPPGKRVVRLHEGRVYRRQPNKRGLFEVASGGQFSWTRSAK